MACVTEESALFSFFLSAAGGRDDSGFIRSGLIARKLRLKQQLISAPQQPSRKDQR